ncbi:MAG: hypothetical protein FRX49_10243, partial [Trebouxia sp. A1-2]
MSSRFTPNSFLYNTRVSLALLPCLVILAGFGGTISICVGMVGSMVIYILDALQHREAALIAVWVCLGLMNMSFGLTALFFSDTRSIMTPILTSVMNGITLFLTGVWATLQFKWVQLQYPVVVLAFEKLLLGGCLPVAATIQVWGVIAALGLAAAPFCLTVILAILYCLFAMPLVSSFAGGSRKMSIGGGNVRDWSVQGRLEGCIGALLFSLLPPLLYAVTNLGLPSDMQHVWSLLLLTSAPLLMLTTLQGGLWWLTSDAGHHKAAFRLVRVLALAGSLIGLEGRVVLPAFGHYLGLHYPWNYMAISAALFGAGSLMLLHLEGVLSGELGSSLGGAALVMSCGAGGVACGLPVWLMPAPLLAGSGIALFYDSGTIRDYCLFTGGAFATGFWFLHHHYWFLNIEIQTHGLRFLCQVILAALLPATLLPGLIIGRGSGALVSLLMLAQAGLVAYLEGQLHGGALEEGRQSYPGYLVVATSAVGLLLSSKAKEGGLLNSAIAGLLNSIYLAKMALLAHLGPIMAVVVAVTAPMLSNSRAKASTGPALHTPFSLLFTTAALASARLVLFDLLLLFLGYPPSAGLLAGASLVALALAQLPLLQQRYPHSQSARRAVAAMAAFGVLLALLRPPLPEKGFAVCPNLPFGLCPRLWDAAHMPEADQDDARLYGSDETGSNAGAAWLLVLAGIIGLAALVPSGGNIAAKRSRSCGGAALMGVPVGLYLALQLFPNQRLMQAIVCTASSSLAAAVGMIQMGGGGSGLLAFLVMAWASLLPLGLFFQAVLPLPLPQGPLPYGGLTPSFEHERAEAYRASLLAVYAPQALLLALAAKLRVSKSGNMARPPRHPSYASRHLRANRAAGFLGACLPGGPASQKGSVGCPQTGNLACLSWLCIALYLNWQAQGAPDEAIFLLAPSLLLLNQDPLLMRGLKPLRRYAPCSLTVTLYLVVSSLVSVVHATWLQPRALVLAHKQTPFYLLLNLACLAAVLPTHLAFLQFLWKPSQALSMWHYLTTPLSVPAFFLSGPYATKLLAISSLGMAALQF